MGNLLRLGAVTFPPVSREKDCVVAIAVEKSLCLSGGISNLWLFSWLCSPVPAVPDFFLAISNKKGWGWGGSLAILWKFLSPSGAEEPNHNCRQNMPTDLIQARKTHNSWLDSTQLELQTRTSGTQTRPCKISGLYPAQQRFILPFVQSVGVPLLVVLDWSLASAKRDNF